tara:strand:+ start:777 stop:1799 length:1023 start_codon:yes stop_codon:yes gene_type:complete
MKNNIKLFDYNLPTELIADTPRAKREQAKLMVYNKKTDDVMHSTFLSLDKYLDKGDLLILNDTKVLPGRLFLKKESGGTVEILFHKSIDKYSFICIFKSSRKIAINSKLFANDENFFKVVAINKNFITLSSNNDPMTIFLKYGQVPLPKYIKREATKDDVERYQTVYAKKLGSVAAPTAGLHFTEDILLKLKHKGVLIDYLTLHVTYNTFKPITVDNYNDHEIGSELCDIRENLISKIKLTRQNNKKIYTVGTTTTRALENYATKSYQGDFCGEADLYITPGYEFKIIDGIITNFHLPQSTLLLLVSSLIGREKLLNLYNLAIGNDYRFYSYGDSMFIQL